jgi:hypothetical protein
MDSIGALRLQGGEEQTRYCTDHLELFRYSLNRYMYLIHFFWLPVLCLLFECEIEMVSVTPPPPLRRQESYFAYLFGVREPGFYGAVVSSLPFLYQRKVNPIFVNALVNLTWVGINYLQLVLYSMCFSGKVN